MFSLSPPNKLSTPMTSYFLFRSSLQIWEPKNPAAPVTKIVLAFLFHFLISSNFENF
jgi:hypothetical protein